VRLNGGVLRVTRVQPEGAKKMGAGEWASSVGLQAGYRFRQA
jgi:methionyl-tRNA formyltransferase